MPYRLSGFERDIADKIALFVMNAEKLMGVPVANQHIYDFALQLCGALMMIPSVLAGLDEHHLLRLKRILAYTSPQAKIDIDKWMSEVVKMRESFVQGGEKFDTNYESSRAVLAELERLERADIRYALDNEADALMEKQDAEQPIPLESVDTLIANVWTTLAFSLKDTDFTDAQKQTTDTEEEETDPEESWHSEILWRLFHRFQDLTRLEQIRMLEEGMHKLSDSVPAEDVMKLRNRLNVIHRGLAAAYRQVGLENRPKLLEYPKDPQRETFLAELEQFIKVVARDKATVREFVRADELYFTNLERLGSLDIEIELARKMIESDEQSPEILAVPLAKIAEMITQWNAIYPDAKWRPLAVEAGESAESVLKKLDALKIQVSTAFIEKRVIGYSKEFIAQIEAFAIAKGRLEKSRGSSRSQTGLITFIAGLDEINQNLGAIAHLSNQAAAASEQAKQITSATLHPTEEQGVEWGQVFYQRFLQAQITFDAGGERRGSLTLHKESDMLQIEAVQRARVEYTADLSRLAGVKPIEHLYSLETASDIEETYHNYVGSRPSHHFQFMMIVFRAARILSEEEKVIAFGVDHRLKEPEIYVNFLDNISLHQVLATLDKLAHTQTAAAQHRYTRFVGLLRDAGYDLYRDEITRRLEIRVRAAKQRSESGDVAPPSLPQCVDEALQAYILAEPKTKGDYAKIREIWQRMTGSGEEDDFLETLARTASPEIAQAYIDAQKLPIKTVEQRNAVNETMLTINASVMNCFSKSPELQALGTTEIFAYLQAGHNKKEHIKTIFEKQLRDGLQKAGIPFMQAANGQIEMVRSDLNLTQADMETWSDCRYSPVGYLRYTAERIRDMTNQRVAAVNESSSTAQRHLKTEARRYSYEVGLAIKLLRRATIQPFGSLGKIEREQIARLLRVKLDADDLQVEGLASQRLEEIYVALRESYKPLSRAQQVALKKFIAGKDDINKKPMRAQYLGQFLDKQDCARFCPVPPRDLDKAEVRALMELMRARYEMSQAATLIGQILKENFNRRQETEQIFETMQGRYSSKPDRVKMREALGKYIKGANLVDLIALYDEIQHPVFKHGSKTSPQNLAAVLATNAEFFKRTETNSKLTTIEEIQVRLLALLADPAHPDRLVNLEKVPGFNFTVLQQLNRIMRHDTRHLGKIGRRVLTDDQEKYFFRAQHANFLSQFAAIRQRIMAGEQEGATKTTSQVPAEPGVIVLPTDVEVVKQRNIEAITVQIKESEARLKKIDTEMQKWTSMLDKASVYLAKVGVKEAGVAPRLKAAQKKRRDELWTWEKVTEEVQVPTDRERAQQAQAAEYRKREAETERLWELADTLSGSDNVLGAAAGLVATGVAVRNSVNLMADKVEDAFEDFVGFVAGDSDGVELPSYELRVKTMETLKATAQKLFQHFTVSIGVRPDELVKASEAERTKYTREAVVIARHITRVKQQIEAAQTQYEDELRYLTDLHEQRQKAVREHIASDAIVMKARAGRLQDVGLLYDAQMKVYDHQAIRIALRQSELEKRQRILAGRIAKKKDAFDKFMRSQLGACERALLAQKQLKQEYAQLNYEASTSKLFTKHRKLRDLSAQIDAIGIDLRARKARCNELLAEIKKMEDNLDADLSALADVDMQTAVLKLKIELMHYEQFIHKYDIAIRKAAIYKQVNVRQKKEMTAKIAKLTGLQQQWLIKRQEAIGKVDILLKKKDPLATRMAAQTVLKKAWAEVVKQGEPSAKAIMSFQALLQATEPGGDLQAPEQRLDALLDDLFPLTAKRMTEPAKRAAQQAQMQARSQVEEMIREPLIQLAEATNPERARVARLKEVSAYQSTAQRQIDGILIDAELDTEQIKRIQKAISELLPIAQQATQNPFSLSVEHYALNMFYQADAVLAKHLATTRTDGPSDDAFCAQCERVRPRIQVSITQLQRLIDGEPNPGRLDKSQYRLFDNIYTNFNDTIYKPIPGPSLTESSEVEFSIGEYLQRYYPDVYLSLQKQHVYLMPRWQKVRDLDQTIIHEQTLRTLMEASDFEDKLSYYLIISAYNFGLHDFAEKLFDAHNGQVLTLARIRDEAKSELSRLKREPVRYLTQEVVAIQARYLEWIAALPSRQLEETALASYLHQFSERLLLPVQELELHAPDGLKGHYRELITNLRDLAYVGIAESFGSRNTSGLEQNSQAAKKVLATIDALPVDMRKALQELPIYMELNRLLEVSLDTEDNLDLFSQRLKEACSALIGYCEARFDELDQEIFGQFDAVLTPEQVAEKARVDRWDALVEALEGIDFYQPPEPYAHADIADLMQHCAYTFELPQLALAVKQARAKGYTPRLYTDDLLKEAVSRGLSSEMRSDELRGTQRHTILLFDYLNALAVMQRNGGNEDKLNTLASRLIKDIQRFIQIECACADEIMPDDREAASRVTRKIKQLSDLSTQILLTTNKVIDKARSKQRKGEMGGEQVATILDVSELLQTLCRKAKFSRLANHLAKQKPDVLLGKAWLSERSAKKTGSKILWELVQACDELFVPSAPLSEHERVKIITEIEAMASDIALKMPKLKADLEILLKAVKSRQKTKSAAATVGTSHEIVPLADETEAPYLGSLYMADGQPIVRQVVDGSLLNTMFEHGAEQIFTALQAIPLPARNWQEYHAQLQLEENQLVAAVAQLQTEKLGLQQAEESPERNTALDANQAARAALTDQARALKTRQGEVNFHQIMTGENLPVEFDVYNRVTPAGLIVIDNLITFLSDQIERVNGYGLTPVEKFVLKKALSDYASWRDAYSTRAPGTGRVARWLSSRLLEMADTQKTRAFPELHDERFENRDGRQNLAFLTETESLRAVRHRQRYQTANVYVGENAVVARLDPIQVRNALRTEYQRALEVGRPFNPQTLELSSVSSQILDAGISLLRLNHGNSHWNYIFVVKTQDDSPNFALSLDSLYNIPPGHRTLTAENTADDIVLRELYAAGISTIYQVGARVQHLVDCGYWGAEFAEIVIQRLQQIIREQAQRQIPLAATEVLTTADLAGFMREAAEPERRLVVRRRRAHRDRQYLQVLSAKFSARPASQDAPVKPVLKSELKAESKLTGKSKSASETAASTPAERSLPVAVEVDGLDQDADPLAIHDACIARAMELLGLTHQQAAKIALEIAQSIPAARTAIERATTQESGAFSPASVLAKTRADTVGASGPAKPIKKKSAPKPKLEARGAGKQPSRGKH